jgi:serine/threonine protein kinase/tetratricopeptide (TPR) repeat protein
MSEPTARPAAVPPEDPPATEPSADFATRRSRKRELLARLRGSWEAGEPAEPEDLLSDWPDNPETDRDVANLLFEDFCQRRLRGEEPSVAEYEERFPGRGDSVAGLLHLQEFLRSPNDLSALSSAGDAGLALPSVQDELFGFRLRQELGYGAFARVFLAEQISLAGRPVVLKVSAISGTEPQTLAQLQHTHIVPIYSLHDDARAGLRAVCMPYFGGATLGSVLQSAWATLNPPTGGHQLVSALEAVSTTAVGMTPSPDVFAGPSPAPQAPGTAAGQTPLGVLGRVSYVRAVAWIGARLAEALDHAHQRGVLHRDIKPSNILLSADGQPMLLDFNLARNARISETQATLGGTVAYMAPEHLRALACPLPELCAHVDHRSDLYSLGMVLYEMLVGQGPFETNASYSPRREMIDAMADERSRGLPPRRFRADIPLGLESIVRKCLAPDPTQRYQEAGHLAEDLRRFLDDRPLRHAPELSWKERAGKWARRHPRLASSGSMAALAAALLVVIGITLFGIWLQLEAAQDRERQQAFDAGTTRALCLVNTTSDLEDHLRRGVPVCEETLALYGVLEWDDWQEHGAWRRLSAEDRQRLAEEVRELLVVLAWARVRTASGDSARLQEALALLDRAEAVQGLPPSQSLWRDRASYLRQLGQTEEATRAEARAAQAAPSTARDHYLLAGSYARHGTREGYAQAVASLNRAIDLNPRHYWSLLQRGICRQELGEYSLATADFSQCVGLWPEFAWGYFNRGCALDQAGHKEQAVADYTAALERDPDLMLAFVNRGLARLELRQFGPALADFEQAQARGRDDAFVHAGRGMALEGLGRPADADAAFAAAFANCDALPPAQRTRLRWAYGFAVSVRLPDRAREAFDAVLRDEPNQPQALYGRAMLLAARKRTDQALGFLNRAVAASPSFVDARRARAVLLARGGRLGLACQDMDWCLDKQPETGVTLYAAACVAALVAHKSTDPTAARRAAGQALAFLHQAFQHGYGRDKAADDPDLASIRTRPEFHRLLARVQRAAQPPSF